MKLYEDDIKFLERYYQKWTGVLYPIECHVGLAVLIFKEGVIKSAFKIKRVK